MGNASKTIDRTRGLEALQLYADGCDRLEISKRMFIQPGTAGAHLSRMKHFLNAKSLGHAVAVAFRAGLVK